MVSPAADDELADRGHVLAREAHRRAQHRHVGTGDGAQRAVFDPRHPRHHGAVAEAQDELGVHIQLAALADDQAHDLGMLARNGMKSIKVAAPSAVSKWVSRMSVFGR